jgi:Spy/CpxP family protein refolding chaperone
MKNLLISFMILVFTFGLVNAQPRREEGRLKNKNIWERLNLSDEQKEKVQNLRLKHQKEMIDLKAELERAEFTLGELKAKKNFSRTDYLTAVEKINEAENKISLSRANHRMDVFELLTDEQKKEFWEIGPFFRMKLHERSRLYHMRDR